MAKNAKNHDELITLLAELEDARLAIEAGRTFPSAAIEPSITQARVRYAEASRAYRKYRLETDFDDVPDAPLLKSVDLYEVLSRRRD